MSRAKKPPAGPFDALRALKLRLEEEQPKGPTADRIGANQAAPTAPPAAPVDDAVLLARALSGVEPLKQTRSRSHAGTLALAGDADRSACAKSTVDDSHDDADAPHAHLRSLVEGRARFEVADDGAHVEGRRVDVPLDSLRRLRRGSLAVDGRLDMHGMTVTQARSQLALFLKTMRARGERCVLVIHGKGDHSPQGAGVLRGEISAWLSQGSPSEHVAAFATARSHDGGEGAVYVLLRR